MARTKLPRAGQGGRRLMRCPSCFGYRRKPDPDCPTCSGRGSIRCSVVNAGSEPAHEELALFGGVE